MTEPSIEALRHAVQAWLDEIPGNTARFTFADAEELTEQWPEPTDS